MLYHFVPALEPFGTPNVGSKMFQPWRWRGGSERGRTYGRLEHPKMSFFFFFVNSRKKHITLWIMQQMCHAYHALALAVGNSKFNMFHNNLQSFKKGHPNIILVKELLFPTPPRMLTDLRHIMCTYPFVCLFVGVSPYGQKKGRSQVGGFSIQYF